MGSHSGSRFGPRFGAASAQESFPSSSFRRLSRPRALQQVLQRVPEGLRVDVTFWSTFCTGLGSHFGDPGPLKRCFFFERHCISDDFAVFDAGSILNPILHPLGLPFRQMFTPKTAETPLQTRLAPPKSGSRLLLCSPEALQKRTPERDPEKAPQRDRTPDFGPIPPRPRTPPRLYIYIYIYIYTRRSVGG